MKKIVVFLLLASCLSACDDDYPYKTDKGKTCGEILHQRYMADQYSEKAQLDSLYLKCGCDSLK